jgi:hypothetical protein
MTKAAIRALIRRRITTSKREATIAAKAGAIAIVNYHEGCIGMGLCLLGDLDPPKRGKKKARKARG